MCNLFSLFENELGELGFLQKRTACCSLLKQLTVTELSSRFKTFLKSVMLVCISNVAIHTWGAHESDNVLEMGF